MSVLKIYSLSKSTWESKDISLRQPTRALTSDEISSVSFKNIILDMFETLYSTPSGVGLAATQVGLQLKLIVIDIKRDAKKPLILINPQYTPLTTETVDSTESCLSVPGVVGTVKRYAKVKIEYQNLYGKQILREATGFESNVFQHEIDHINGILYVDRLEYDQQVKQDNGHINRMAHKAVDKLLEVNINEN